MARARKHNFRIILGIGFREWSEQDCVAIYHSHDKSTLGPRVAKYVMLMKFGKSIE